MQNISELILNSDGSIFHLNLFPGDISEKIIIVDNRENLNILSSLLKEVRVRKMDGEFSTVTGTFDLGEITIISCGRGTGNIDILMNELDALANIDLNTGISREDLISLSVITLGTCAALREDIPVGTAVISDISVGFDGFLHFYEGYDWILDTPLSDTLAEFLEWPDTQAYPYAVKASRDLIELFSSGPFLHGIAVSAPGFYAPHGRKLRLETFDNEINGKLSSFTFRGKNICNYDMDSSAFYGLSALLGHKAMNVRLNIVNMADGVIMHDYKSLYKDLATTILHII